MSKIAIVGVKGSGKTVLMSVLGEKYQVADVDGLVMVPENADAFSFVKVNMAKMRDGGWPMETPHDSMRAMRWSLQRERDDGPNKVFCDLDFLDFGGEIYTDAFGSGPTAKSDMWANERETLKHHIESSQMLVVLVNLRDVVSGATDPDTLSALWVTKGMLDYARRDLQLANLAIAFTQVDAYREVIESCGGLKSVLKKYVPHIYSGYRDLPLFALSAVDKTVEDKDGLLVPAPDFGSKGLEELVHWILGCTERATTSGDKVPQKSGETALRHGKPAWWYLLIPVLSLISAYLFVRYAYVFLWMIANLSYKIIGVFAFDHKIMDACVLMFFMLVIVGVVLLLAFLNSRLPMKEPVCKKLTKLEIGVTISLYMIFAILFRLLERFVFGYRTDFAF